jgi:hypothetical protein
MYTIISVMSIYCWRLQFRGKKSTFQVFSGKFTQNWPNILAPHNARIESQPVTTRFIIRSDSSVFTEDSRANWSPRQAVVLQLAVP